MTGAADLPDWPPLTLADADLILRHYPQFGFATELLSESPRPLSSAGIVSTPAGPVFIKRHHRSVRSKAGLLEEHRFLQHLAAASWIDSPTLIQRPYSNSNGETVVFEGEWTCEVHPVAPGLDLYEDALSWTPFQSTGHARAAGRALARLHHAAAGFSAPPRQTGQLVTSFTIFAGNNIEPAKQMEAYLATRPLLQSYAEARNWRRDLQEIHLPFYRELEPWTSHLTPLWTHNDFHASNLMWTVASPSAEVANIVDFGLSDRTNTVHDLATTIERNIVEWLRLGEPDIVRFDHLDALLSGYLELRPLQYPEARALVSMLPLVHCEFALSETDYFLSILHSEEKAKLAYEGYFLRHTAWFLEPQGRQLLAYLSNWIEKNWADTQGRAK